MKKGDNPISGGTPLQGWKEIAVYLDRDARTARRWELEAGLPVRRHGGDRGSVYAYPRELDAWRAAHKPKAQDAYEPRPVWRRALPVVAVALILTVAVWIVRNGPILNPPGPLVEAADAGSGVRLRQVWAGPEVNTYGAPSPDGRFLTFTDLSTPSLGIRDLTTGESRLLAKGSWDDPVEFPMVSRFSPEGSQVISLWFNKGEFGDLRVVPVNPGPGSGAPRLLFGNKELTYLHPSDWSPDGKSVLTAFWLKDGSTQIVLVSVGDGSITVLKTLDWRSPGVMRFSPDGRFIAYEFPPKEDAPEHDIFVLAIDGSREVHLIQHPADERLFGWAPDGGHILFGSDRTGAMGAWVIEVSEGKPKGQPKLLKPDLGRISPMGITRDGSFYYALTTGIRDIYVATVDPATGKVLEAPHLASQRFVGANRGPEWSPDGKYMAYFVRHGNNVDSIFIRDLKTGRERELISNLRTNLNIRPRWSPDGRSLLVDSRHDRGRPAIYRVDVETGAIEGVLPGVRVPHWAIAFWSADGKSIIYVQATVDDDGGTIRIRNLDTGEDKELFRPEERTFVNNLALSPDGRSLAFGLSRPSGIIGKVLMVMPLDGGQPRELLRVSEQFASVNWTPDGKYLVFAGGGQLWRIPAEGGEPQALGLKPHKGSTTLSVHPDGRRIAFTAGDPSKEVWVMENFWPGLREKQ